MVRMFGGDVLAPQAVAACRADGEPALLVDQGDGQAVDLGLEHEAGDLAAEQAAGAGVPGPQRLLVEGVGRG